MHTQSAITRLTFRQQHGHAITVISRTLAAVVGGYLATAGCAALFALILPMDKADSTLLSMMLSFILWASLAIYAFAAKSSAKVWLLIASMVAISLAGTGAMQ